MNIKVSALIAFCLDVLSAAHRRIAQPDDVGEVIAFLASDAARWISGDTVRVDGGSKL